MRASGRRVRTEKEGKPPAGAGAFRTKREAGLLPQKEVRPFRFFRKGLLPV